MKKAKELEVDTIGGHKSPLTKEEEKAISNFIMAEKEKRRLKELKRKTLTKKRQLT
jgi:hypothetical protein